MKFEMSHIAGRTKPINCLGIKATREGAEGNWRVELEEYPEMVFDQDDAWMLDALNKSWGMRYKKCIAWHQIAGCNYACFEMCDEEQREACTRQQEEDTQKKS